MLFYASPILYVATMVPGRVPAGVPRQPDRDAILTQVRHAVVDPGAPTAAELDRRRGLAARSRSRSRRWCWHSVRWVFSREAPRIAENL